MKGFHYFSSGCRAKGKRGGGAAVIINVKKIQVISLNLCVPSIMEVVWAKIRPKIHTKDTLYRDFIVCTFYSPPRKVKIRNWLST